MIRYRVTLSCDASDCGSEFEGSGIEEALEAGWELTALAEEFCPIHNENGT